jgi:tetratricopeptide (TPR) repeat protein
MRARTNPAQVPRDLIAGGVLFVVTFAAYLPALDGQFLWDDDAHVTAPSLRSLSGLWRIWADARATQQYYPLTHSAFWLAYQLWGANPIGYHVLNVALHVASALLFWQVLRRLRVRGAWLAAAIFALHPVNVESVAWITELKNTLSGVFYLAALLAYLHFDPPGEALPATRRKGAVNDPRDWRVYGLALALFVGALLSKTVTASLPAALLLIVWWKEGRLSWRRHAVPLLPFFVIGAALGLTTAWVERHLLGAEGEAFAFTWVDRGLIAGRALWFYASKLLWPVNLIFIYPRWTIDRLAWWQYLYPASALAILLALWTVRGRLGRGPLAAALFFGGTLVPALGFFNVYPFLYSFVADHFQYLACLGLITLGSALIAGGLARAGAWQRPAGHAVCTVLLLVLAALTWRQAHLYQDLERLYRDVIARNPSGGMAYLNLGGFYWQQGRHAEAIDVYRTLIAVRPDYVRAYSNLGVVYASEGRYEEAIGLYRRALAIKPDFMAAHYELGLAHAAQGRHADAIAEYRAALAIQPDSGAARYQLGRSLAARGQQAEAIAEYKAALGLTPDFVAGYQSLAAAYNDLGRYPDAIAALKAALAIMPGSSETYNNLGLLYRKHGQLAEAIAAYRSAIAIKPDFAAAYTNLGAAYGAQGNYREAIAAWQSAVRLDPSSSAGQAAQANIEIARARLVR